MDTDAANDVLSWIRSRFFGKYRAMVVDNADPTNRGRIQVRVPAVLESQPVWAMPCVPYAGNNMGLYAIPEPGSGIWVEFESGDVSYPIWTGCFWADNERPSNENGTQATPPLKILRTKQGLMVSMDDDGQTISVSDENGSNVLKIEVQRNQITLKGACKAVVEAPQIELVENATHPVVFGDELLQYLMQFEQAYLMHTHPGETAAGIPVTPATPVPPPPFSSTRLVSSKVTSG